MLTIHERRQIGGVKLRKGPVYRLIFFFIAAMNSSHIG